MAQLPLIKIGDPAVQQMETLWKSALDPVLANLLLQGNLISNITLNNGVTVINHKLGRMQLGWFLTDNTGIATIYRSQPFNNLTLTLTSNASEVVSIWCF